MAAMGWAHRAVDARKASFAPIASWSAKLPSSTDRLSRSTRRVIEARMPVSSAGVRRRPSCTQKIEQVGPSSTTPSERTSSASS